MHFYFSYFSLIHSEARSLTTWEWERVDENVSYFKWEALPFPHLPPNGALWVVPGFVTVIPFLLAESNSGHLGNI